MLISFLLASCLTPACPGPQGQPEPVSQANFVGVAQAFSLDHDTWGPDDQQLHGSLVYQKDAGFSALPPSERPPGVGAPSFELSSIFQLQLQDIEFEIDAMSLNLNWIIANPIGQTQMEAGQWGGLTLSVTRGTTGAGVIRAEAEAEDGAAADLFSHIIEGSDPLALPGWVIGKTMRAQNSNEISVYATARQGNIDAHDLFISMFAQDSGTVQILRSKLTGFYFSVTRETVGPVPDDWWNGSDPSGASILRVPWDNDLGWQTPELFLSFEDLGLQSHDEVDALAYDSESGYALFSTKEFSVPEEDPIMFANLEPPITTSVYRTPSGTPISQLIGLDPMRQPGPDDVDAICSTDPRQHVLPYLLGRPLPGAPVTAEIHSSVFRQYSPAVGQQLVTHLVGWPPPGRQGGVATVTLTFPGGPPILLGTLARDPFNPMAGDPLQFTVAIPPALAFTGLPGRIDWTAVSNVGLFASPNTVELLF